MTRSMAITASGTATQKGTAKWLSSPQPLGRGGRRQPHGRDREEQAQQDGVEHHQPQVAAPAQGLGDGQGPPRGAQLPQGHEGEDAEEGAEADGRLVGLDEAVQGGSASGRGSGCWGAVTQYWQIRGDRSTDTLNVMRGPRVASSLALARPRPSGKPNSVLGGSVP